MSLSLTLMPTQSHACPECGTILNKMENQATTKEIIDVHKGIPSPNDLVQDSNKRQCSKCGNFYYPTSELISSPASFNKRHNDAVADFCRDGHTVIEASQEFRIRNDMVSRICRVRGVKPKRAIPIKIKDEVWKGIDWGKDDSIIAIDIGCSTTTVTEKRKKLGLPKPVTSTRKEKIIAWINANPVSVFMTRKEIMAAAGINGIPTDVYGDYFRTNLRSFLLMNWELPNKTLGDIWKISVNFISLWRVMKAKWRFITGGITDTDYVNAVKQEKIIADKFFAATPIEQSQMIIDQTGERRTVVLNRFKALKKKKRSREFPYETPQYEFLFSQWEKK